MFRARDEADGAACPGAGGPPAGGRGLALPARSSIACRQREWRGSGHDSLRLSYYEGRTSQPRHTHDHAQLSFLLSGALEETIDRRTFTALTPSVSVKPAGMPHADTWGPNGTLILSVRTNERELPAGSGGWSPLVPGLVTGAMRAARDEPLIVDELITDLVSCAADREAYRSMPPWLDRVSQAIAEAGMVSAAEAARVAGVHRVHLSRSFVRYLGITFVAFRRYCMLARAIEGAMASPEALAQIAISAGFADQAHMQREIRAALGITPRAFRSLLG